MVKTNLNINDWALEDRPREKMLAQGAHSLTNAELLAILIGSGTVNENALTLTKRILTDCDNNLNQLGKLDLTELIGYKGIGTAKAVTIMAACELGKRRALTKAMELKDLGSSEAIYQFMHSKMQDLTVEEAWILLMNNHFKLIKAKQISKGGLTETSVDVRVIMKEAIINNATVVALCHNHPSNSTMASTNDDKITQKVKEVCELMRIYFLDHLIITDGNYYSYRDRGKLD